MKFNCINGPIDQKTKSFSDSSLFDKIHLYQWTNRSNTSQHSNNFTVEIQLYQWTKRPNCLWFSSISSVEIHLYQWTNRPDTSQHSNSFSVQIQLYQWTKRPNRFGFSAFSLLKFICTNGPMDQKRYLVIWSIGTNEFQQTNCWNPRMIWSFGPLVQLVLTKPKVGQPRRIGPLVQWYINFYHT
jgi:hypothetical protein